MPHPVAGHRLTALLLWPAVGMLLAACGSGSRPSGNAGLELRWTIAPDPPQVGTAEIQLDVADVAWRPRNGARVVLTGMRDGVALVVDTARGEGAGRYRAPNFRFEVAGAWTLRARVETPEGRWTQEDLQVEVVAGEP